MRRNGWKNWWVPGVTAAALAPLVVTGCQKSMSLDNPSSLKADPVGVITTAGEAATRDPLAAVPSDKPIAANGEAIWKTHCQSCHGASGEGDGPRSGEFAGRLKDLSAYNYTRNIAPLTTYVTISGGDEPHPYGDRSKPDTYLTDQQRWDVVSYVWMLHTTYDSLKRGGTTFVVNCSVCHGTMGYGDGQLAHTLNPKPRKFTDFQWMMDKPDNRLYRSIHQGRRWTAMPGWSHLLTERDIYDIVDFLRQYNYTYPRDIIIERPTGPGSH